MRLKKLSEISGISIVTLKKNAEYIGIDINKVGKSLVVSGKDAEILIKKDAVLQFYKHNPIKVRIVDYHLKGIDLKGISELLCLPKAMINEVIKEYKIDSSIIVKSKL